ncbi:hypothetical protein CDAR_277621 [Caerostris darwini]|uniref:Uncharacterized protein n=1 Tax=Caerostris darwini TaxID=1538125 RepID=A0AAV4PD22_9ARAC|nr:hypothetical protein CDAR_277621 [Caerostris darwini]
MKPSSSSGIKRCKFVQDIRKISNDPSPNCEILTLLSEHGAPGTKDRKWDINASGYGSCFRTNDLKYDVVAQDSMLGPKDRKWDINGSGYGYYLCTNDLKCDVIAEDSMRISGEVVCKDPWTL